jgi:tetratricopeptide (TPR) repeat protein
MLSVFTAADPFENHGKQMTANELLDQAGRSIKGDLNEQPEVRARLLEAIGRAYRRQGQSNRSIEYLEDSLKLREQAPDNVAQSGSVLTELALAFREEGRLEESDHAFQRAIEISEHSTGVKTKVYAQLLVDLGRLELQRGNLDGGEEYFSRSLVLTRELYGPEHPEVASIFLDLASTRLWRDDFDGAEEATREAERIYRQSTPKLHPDRVTAEFRLGEVLLLQRQMAAAAALFEGVIAAQRILFGNNSRAVANTLNALATARLAQNRLGEAHDFIEQAVNISKALGDTSYFTGNLKNSFALILLREKEFDLAEKNVQEALDLYAKSLSPDHQYVASSEYALGEILLATNRLPEAEAVLTASMDRWKRTNSPAWRIARSASALGEAVYRQGRVGEAQKYLVEGYQNIRSAQGADEHSKTRARERIAWLYEERKKAESVRLKPDLHQVKASNDVRSAAP